MSIFVDAIYTYNKWKYKDLFEMLMLSSLFKAVSCKTVPYITLKNVAKYCFRPH